MNDIRFGETGYHRMSIKKSTEYLSVKKMGQYWLMAYWLDILTGLILKASCSTFIDKMTLEKHTSCITMKWKGRLLT